jgi:formiminotetrahydrofolate cyclodeaminase
MKLIERSIEVFSDMLASDSPTPGGGTASALTASLGAGFIAMVARITAGKPDFTGEGERLLRLAREADRLRRLFLRLVDEDSAAYQRFAAAAAETGAAERELRACVEPPLELLEGICEALRLARELSGRYYLPAASDVGLAALTLETAARGAALTVNINLKHIKDRVFAAGASSKSRRLLDEAEAVSKEIYGQVKSYVEN